MRRLFPFIVCVVFSCQVDPVQQNPYLNNLPPFEFELNLDLPLYDNLRGWWNAIHITDGAERMHLYNLDGAQT